MTAFDVPESTCPHCGYLPDVASLLTKPDEQGDTPAAPVAGDLTICLNCANVLRFGVNLRLEAVTPLEAIMILLTFPALADAQAALMEMLSRRSQH